MTYVGATRFEDNARLPVGVAVNSNNYAAMALTQVRFYSLPCLAGCTQQVAAGRSRPQQATMAAAPLSPLLPPLLALSLPLRSRRWSDACLAMCTSISQLLHGLPISHTDGASARLCEAAEPTGWVAQHGTAWQPPRTCHNLAACLQIGLFSCAAAGQAVLDNGLVRTGPVERACMPAMLAVHAAPATPAGKETGLVVQDAAAFAAEGEQLSFLQLQARAAMVRQVRGRHGGCMG